MDQPTSLPVIWMRCPVHGRLVSLRGDGSLITRCTDCLRESHDAHRHIGILGRSRNLLRGKRKAATA